MSAELSRFVPQGFTLATALAYTQGWRDERDTLAIPPRRKWSDAEQGAYIRGRDDASAARTSGRYIVWSRPPAL